MTPIVNEKGHEHAQSETPSNAEIQREKDATRRAVLAAMQRILLGHPKNVQLGCFSVSHLAAEAQIGRHHLYTGLTDLRNRFEYLREKAGKPTEKEVELQAALDRTKAEIASVRNLQARTRRQAADWKALTELLARAISTLQEELHQEQLKGERLARKLHKIEERTGSGPAAVLLHRRRGIEPIPTNGPE